MPVRSLNSSVLKWPDKSTIVDEFQNEVSAIENDTLVAAGYFGSYARGNYGFGSDLDVIIIVTYADKAAIYRAEDFVFYGVSVPVEVTVLTAEEYSNMKRSGSRFIRMLEEESVLVYGAFPRETLPDIQSGSGR